MNNLSKRLSMRSQWLLRKAQKRIVSTAPFLSKNYQSLKALEGIHRGEKAVILGMGPSLRKEDLELFQGFKTFACNKIFLGFNETEWRPDYYSVSDILVAENNQDQILGADLLESTILHSSIVRSVLKNHAGALFYDYGGSLQGLPEGSDTFAQDLAAGICFGGCSICVDQLQLAFHLGFAEVYLVGIDFSFDVKASKVVGNSKSGDVLKSVGEVNHFHQDYRKPGETWTVPKLEEQRAAFAICRRIYENAGRKLYNASRQTKLDVLERVDFESVFCANN